MEITLLWKSVHEIPNIHLLYHISRVSIVIFSTCRKVHVPAVYKNKSSDELDLRSFRYVLVLPYFLQPVHRSSSYESLK